jgi:glycine/D-amino acid oxidase-like deaminating enzyme
MRATAAPAAAAPRRGARAPSPWLDDAPPALRPARLPGSAEVAVVGGGVIGTAAAYWLARAGAEVLLLEACLPAWGASGRNAGLVLGGPASLELVRGVMAEEGIDAGWHEPGHLALASSAAVLERFRTELAARPPGAAPLEVLDPAACRALLGTRISPRFHGGRWMPRAGALHPARFVRGLAEAAARHGVTVATGTPVLSLSPPGRGEGWEVRTRRRTVRARQVVLACNARGARLLPPLAPVLSPSRGQMLATRPLPPLFGPAMAVDYGTVYWRQLGDGTVLIGGCREADPEAEWSGRAALNPCIQAALEAFLPAAFPDVGAVSAARRWAGIMDATPDGRPLVGAWPGTPGMWVAAGFGGHGLPPALGAGKALARAIIDGASPPELAAMDPARFAEAARC